VPLNDGKSFIVKHADHSPMRKAEVREGSGCLRPIAQCGLLTLHHVLSLNTHTHCFHFSSLYFTPHIKKGLVLRSNQVTFISFCSALNDTDDNFIINRTWIIDGSFIKYEFI